MRRRRGKPDADIAKKGSELGIATTENRPGPPGPDFNFSAILSKSPL